MNNDPSVINLLSVASEFAGQLTVVMVLLWRLIIADSAAKDCRERTQERLNHVESLLEARTASQPTNPQNQ